MFLALVVTGLYLMLGTSVQTYFQQQHDMRKAQERYDAIHEANEQLKQHANELSTDAEVRRLARERFGMIEPGQEAYVIVTPSPAR